MTDKSKSHDTLLLILTALVVCVFLVGSVLLIERYHIRSVWYFLAWHSIFVAVVFIDDFGARIKKPSFAAFISLWALIHGTMIALLMPWMSIVAMIPLIAIEVRVLTLFLRLFELCGVYSNYPKVISKNIS